MTSSGSERRHPGGLRPIAGAVGEALRSLGLEEKVASRRILAHWEDVVGPDIAAHVQALDIEDDAVILTADHGAWRQEVNMLADRILAALNERRPERPVRELRWTERPRARKNRRR